MSLIVEALKKSQKEKAEKNENDKGFKITTILSPGYATRKGRLFLSKNIFYPGILVGSVLFLAFASSLFRPSVSLKNEVRDDINHQLMAKAPERVEVEEALVDRRLKKITPDIKLKKTEASSNSTRKTPSPPEIKKEKTPTEKILTKRVDIESEGETQKTEFIGSE